MCSTAITRMSSTCNYCYRVLTFVDASPPNFMLLILLRRTRPPHTGFLANVHLGATLFCWDGHSCRMRGSLVRCFAVHRLYPQWQCRPMTRSPVRCFRQPLRNASLSVVLGDERYNSQNQILEHKYAPCRIGARS